MTVQPSKYGAPKGEYLAVFKGTEPVTKSRYDYPAIEWVFEILEGAHRGRQVSKLTRAQPGPGKGGGWNTCGQFLAAVTGTQLTEGVTLDPDAWIGQRYRVLVEES
jgi:hypothetical protein